MGDSLERVLLSLVVEGALGFQQTNDKIQADLTSTERAGKRAEGAAAAAESTARNAEKASLDLARNATQALAKIARAFQALDPKSGGGILAGAIGEGIGTGFQVGRLASTFLGPELGIPIGAIAGLGSAVYSGVNQSNALAAQEKKDREIEAERHAELIAAAIGRQREHDVDKLLADQAALAKFGNVTSGNARRGL